MQDASPTKVTWSDEGSKHVLPEQSEGTPPVTSTSNVASGYVGEMLGTIRSGTGGSSYSARTTTNPTTSNGILVSVTLNPGVYLISSSVFTQLSAAANFAVYAAVGTTQVSNLIYSSAGAGYGTSVTFTIPVVITAASTVVSIYGLIGSGTASGSAHEMWAVRIA